MSALFAGVGEGFGVGPEFFAVLYGGFCCFLLSPFAFLVFCNLVYEWNRRRDANRGGGKPL